MNLTDLRAMGLVQSNPLIKREIPVKYYALLPEDQWASPTEPERETTETEATVTVWLRKFTAADKINLSSASDNDRAYVAIQRSTFTEDGKPLFPSEDDARGLDLNMFGPLLNAINDLNNHAEKKSQAMTNSSANSPSPSAGTRSRNSAKN